MESNGSGFGAAVRDHLRWPDPCRHGCDGDDRAVVGCDHCWNELANESEMAEDVDLEDFIDGFFGGV